jgi:hypothetical protein
LRSLTSHRRLPVVLVFGGFAENVKWLEVNRIINVLSMGEFPFKSEKIGVKRPKRTKTEDKEVESGQNDEIEDEGTLEDDAEDNEEDEEAKKEAKREASVKSLTRRIYPPHFKVRSVTRGSVPRHADALRLNEDTLLI